MIPPDNSTYVASLVLKSTDASEAMWEPVALFDQIGTASDYAEMCDTYARGHRYVAAEVTCAPQDLVPVEAELPLFRRRFQKDALKVFQLSGDRPKVNASTRESVIPGKYLRSV
jgi:hypothetical protein